MVAPLASERSLEAHRGHRERDWRRPLLYASLALLPISIALALSPLSGWLAIALAAVGIFGILAVHNVPRRPGQKDQETGKALMAAAGRPSMQRPELFEDEVELAYLIQQVIFDVAPFEKRGPDGRKAALPSGGKRELSDLVAARTGHCFDRSRAIETLLRLHGLKTRHVSIFAVRDGDTQVRAFLRRSSLSHSLTEVKTSKGWMIVDSNFRFVAASADGEVFDARELAKLPTVKWDSRNRELPPKIIKPFTWVYGLYSRHGRFYPPYTRFPNVNWRELTYNLLR